MSKTCSKCKKLLNYSNFYKNKKTSTGLYSQCKKCAQLIIRKYINNNINKVKEINNIWKNKNKDLIKQRTKAWFKNNRHIANFINAKRKSSKLKATPKWLTKEDLFEIKKFYEECKEFSWLSEEPLEVDHIIPLQGKNVCGLHVPWNLRIIPKSENLKKGNRL